MVIRSIIELVIIVINKIMGPPMQLSDIQPGQSARILSLGSLDAPVRRKLMAMGLLPCSEVRYIRSAPMGDPLQITTGGITLSVQKELAVLIEVESL